jgi:adenylosuccinate lyase
MKEQIAKIKNHLKANTRIYVVGGTCFIVGSGLTAVVAAPQLIQIVDALKVQYKTITVNNIINQMQARGHAGNVIRCNETGEIFASQGHAAELLGIDARNISAQLNGRRKHADGMTFEKLGVAKN